MKLPCKIVLKKPVHVTDRLCFRFAFTLDTLRRDHQTEVTGIRISYPRFHVDFS